MVRRLGWVTAGEARGRDPDEPLVLAVLAEHGVHVSVVNWDDPTVDWSAFDRVVIRSPWDYQDRPDDFLRWVRSVESQTELRNPVAPMQWSLDKHYLRELAEAGVAVIPTEFVEPGTALGALDAPCVIKPSVGAGSRDVAVFHPGEDNLARQHVARLHERQVSALVQPLLASVAADGEWPMVFFNGSFSHTASKRVHLPDPSASGELFAIESNQPFTASAEQIEAAERAMQHVQRRFGTLTYGRVDLVRDDDGRYLVLEVELVEPSLFLPEGGAAAVLRCAAALIA